MNAQMVSKLIILAATTLMASVAPVQVVAAQTGHNNSAAGITGNVVKIGIITDMSGPLSSMTGTGSITAAKMAISDFGGSVLGEPIQLVTIDGKNSPEIGSTTARRWIERDGVDMITGLATSSVALAVQAVAATKNTMTITIGAATTALTDEHCAPLSLHYVYDTYALAAGTAKAVVKNGGKRWFFITVDYAYGHSLEKNTTKIINELGGSVVGSVFHPLGTTDFASYLVKAKASNADVIALANSGTDLVNAVKQARQFRVGENKQLVGLLVFLENAKALGLKNLQGMQFTLAWYWDMNDQTRAFAERFEKKTGEMPNMLSAGMYSAVKTYLTAVKETGTDNSEVVRSQLAKMKLNDMFHHDAWVREDGRVMNDMYLMQAKTPDQSHGSWDLLKLVHTIPAKEAAMPLAQSQCNYVTKTR